MRNTCQQFNQMLPLPRDGTFWAKNVLTNTDLKFNVESVGSVKLPISHDLANQLITVATPAKFGLRDQTLHDESVRNTWEILPDKLLFKDDLWDTLLGENLEIIKRDLGLGKKSILTPHLHNMLVYEKGQFFKAHQDSEKLDNMVATLLVILPCEHEGGKLTIVHNGEVKTFESSEYHDNQVAFIAFYADCHHSVDPIVSGNRVVLAYNLVLENNDELLSKIGPGPEEVQLAQSMLRKHFQKSRPKRHNYQSDELKSPKKIAFMLDHQYTSSGLSWSHLKNTDARLACLLKEVAGALVLEILLAIVKIKEFWEYNVPISLSRDRDNYTTEELSEKRGLCQDEMGGRIIGLHSWRNTDNQKLTIGSFEIDIDGLVWKKPIDGYDPNETEYTPYMGNYGESEERWYERAAIVLWRKEDTYALRLEMNSQQVLVDLIGNYDKNNSQLLAKQVMHLLPYMRHDVKGSHLPHVIEMMLSLACFVEDPKIARDLLEDFDMTIFYNPEEKSYFVTLFAIYGKHWMCSMFSLWLEAKRNAWLSGGFTAYSLVCWNREETEQGKKFSDFLLEYQFAQLDDSDSIELVIDLFKVSLYTKNQSWIAKMIDFVSENSRKYSPCKISEVVEWAKGFKIESDLYGGIDGYVNSASIGSTKLITED